MKERELNKLLDKAIGTKGNLKVPSFWMRQIFKELIEWCKSQNNSQDYITEEELNNRDYATYSDLNNKQDRIYDLTTIRNNANNALKSIPSEYVTEAELEQKKCRIDWDIIGRPNIGYLTFNALEDGTFSFAKRGSGNDIQYSKDNGTTWATLASGKTVSVVAGDKVMWKSTILSGIDGIGTFSSTGNYSVEGNIMSLLCGDEYAEKSDTTDISYAFWSLFSSSTKLIDAFNLILPATKLANSCYRSMFKACTSLITAPEIIPATTLASFCCYDMFYGCESLILAPKLPATTLANGCYQRMFYSCGKLTTAPKKLPATTLANNCYSSMFSGCTSLVNAPELPATTLADSCYYAMFNNCSKLNNIVMLATDASANNCLQSWVYGVASTGTFIKQASMTSLPLGDSGRPRNWEEKNYITHFTECTSLTITADEVDGNNTTTNIYYTAICNGLNYKGDTVIGFIKEGIAVSDVFSQNTSDTETVQHTITFEFMGRTASTTITQGIWVNFEQQYLTFEAIEDSKFKLTRNSCEYSLDEGETWTSLPYEINTPTVSAGNKIMLKATNPTIISSYGIGTFSSTGKFKVKGNIMSMLYGDDFKDKVDLTDKNWAFTRLFQVCTKVVDASNLILPATTLDQGCYNYMFTSCTSLTTAPILPATTLAKDCYNSMFYNCTSLAIAPELPATNLAPDCYYGMFRYCTSLTTPPELPATTLATSCYSNMFIGCTSLTTAPVLHATTLATYCYYYMFQKCSSLNSITMLATVTATESLKYWVDGVASTGTFTKAASMTSLPTGGSGIPEGWTVVDYVES